MYTWNKFDLGYWLIFNHLKIQIIIWLCNKTFGNIYVLTDIN